jgi:hypothetical protein
VANLQYMLAEAEAETVEQAVVIAVVEEFILAELLEHQQPSMA